MSAPGTPAVVLGGTGYVAGELLRLLAAHPSLRLAAALSESRAGTPVGEVFPHLAGAYPRQVLASAADLPGLLAGGGEVALFSALPHGRSAAAVDAALGEAERAGTRLRVVDLSADFRYPDAAEFAAVYGEPHPAPHRLAAFVSALPEHLAGRPEAVGHPGCFPTAVSLAAVPLLALGLVEPELFVAAVTGSTGAGRAPTPATHHPERRSNLFAYGVLAHRHEPEMRRLARAATGVAAEIDFVPHSGPFARGIHATLHARLAGPATSEEVAAAVTSFYAGAPFVRVLGAPPRLQSVVGSNLAALHFAARGRSLVALVAIDNLVKGAAGGAIQWMNRLLGLPETAGLDQPGPGWL